MQPAAGYNAQTISPCRPSSLRLKHSPTEREWLLSALGPLKLLRFDLRTVLPNHPRGPSGGLPASPGAPRLALQDSLDLCQLDPMASHLHLRIRAKSPVDLDGWMAGWVDGWMAGWVDEMEWNGMEQPCSARIRPKLVPNNSAPVPTRRPLEPGASASSA